MSFSGGSDSKESNPTKFDETEYLDKGRRLKAVVPK